MKVEGFASAVLEEVRAWYRRRENQWGRRWPPDPVRGSRRSLDRCLTAGLPQFSLVPCQRLRVVDPLHLKRRIKRSGTCPFQGRSLTVPSTCVMHLGVAIGL